MKKNKKRNILKILVGLIGLAIIIFLIINNNIKNIYVKGNKILTDQEIIELAGIENYPKIFEVSTIKI